MSPITRAARCLPARLGSLYRTNHPHHVRRSIKDGYSLLQLQGSRTRMVIPTLGEFPFLRHKSTSKSPAKTGAGNKDNGINVQTAVKITDNMVASFNTDEKASTSSAATEDEKSRGATIQRDAAGEAKLSGTSSVERSQDSDDNLGPLMSWAGVDSKPAGPPVGDHAAEFATWDPNQIHFVALGGCGRIGMNLYVYAYKGRLIAVDAGTMIPTTSMRTDIVSVLPDYSFLEQNVDHLDAIVITHGHLDHIGALATILKTVKVPVYATRFAAETIRRLVDRKREFGEISLADKDEALTTLKVVRLDDLHRKIGPFDITWFRINHSTPESCALVIRTEAGTIFHTGDWKFDDDPLIDPVTDMNALKEVGKSGVLAVVGDSTNADVPLGAPSEGEVRKSLLDIVCKTHAERPNGRILVATFASNVARLQSIAAVAKETGRKNVLMGSSLIDCSVSMSSCGYSEGYAMTTVDDTRNSFDILDPSSILITCTGCQGEPHSILHRCAYGLNPPIQLEEGDTVIFSSSVIPGNQVAVQKMIDLLIAQGVHVIQNSANDLTHVTGHPSKEEIQTLLDLLKPRILLPVHGELHHQQAHEEIAQEYGIPHTEVPQNGDVFRMSQGGAELVSKLDLHVTAVWDRSAGSQLLYKEDLYKRSNPNSVASALVLLYIDENGVLHRTPHCVLQLKKLVSNFKNRYIDHTFATVEHIKSVLQNLPKSVNKKDKTILRRYLIEEVERFHETTLGQAIPTYIHINQVHNKFWGSHKKAQALTKTSNHQRS